MGTDAGTKNLKFEKQALAQLTVGFATQQFTIPSSKFNLIFSYPCGNSHE